MPLDRAGQGKPPPTTTTKPAPASPAATEVHAEHFRVALGLFFWVLLKLPGALSALHAEHRIAERRRTLPGRNDGAREHGTARRSGLVAGTNQMAVCCRHTRVYRCQSGAPWAACEGDAAARPFGYVWQQRTLNVTLQM